MESDNSQSVPLTPSAPLLTMNALAATTPEGLFPTDRMGHTASFIDGKVYIFGGENPDESKCFRDLFSYDVQTGAWARPSTTVLAPPKLTGHPRQ